MAAHVIVTPVYEDSEAATQLFLELREALGPTITIVAVDDGSVCDPIQPETIAAAGLQGIVIRLKRNVGHQTAIAVGISYVSEYMPNAMCVVMDSDGEDTPKSVLPLIAQLTLGNVDVIVARRRKRSETLKFQLFYVVYKIFFKIMTGRQISFGNYMALTPYAVQRLSAMQELWTHVAGCVLLSKLRISHLPLDRGNRYAGRSKMTFAGLVLHAFRAFMVFAEDVLVRAGIACAAVSFLAILGVIMSVLLKSIGMATPGWFSVALGILILVLLQTSALTLMSLMLTGIVRGGNLLSANYRELVEEILPAAPAGASAPRFKLTNAS